MATATQKVAEKPTEKKEDFSFPDVTIPKGQELAITARADGWWRPDPEKSREVLRKEYTVQGKILERFTTSQPEEVVNLEGEKITVMRKRDTVKVKLSRPCRASIQGEDGKSVPGVLKPGQIIAVPIKARLQELLYYVEHHGVCTIIPVAREKFKNRSMWSFEVFVEGQRSAPPPSKKEDTEVSEGDDIIPF